MLGFVGATAVVRATIEVGRVIIWRICIQNRIRVKTSISFRVIWVTLKPTDGSSFSDIFWSLDLDIVENLNKIWITKMFRDHRKKKLWCDFRANRAERAVTKEIIGIENGILQASRMLFDPDFYLFGDFFLLSRSICWQKRWTEATKLVALCSALTVCHLTEQQRINLSILFLSESDSENFSLPFTVFYVNRERARKLLHFLTP